MAKTRNRKRTPERPSRISSGELTLGLLVLLTPLVFLPDLLDPFQLPKQAVLIVGAVALGLAVNNGSNLPRDPKVWCLLGLLVVAAVASTVFGSDQLGSVMGNNGYRNGLLTYLALAVAFVAAGNFVTGERNFVRLSYFWLAAGAAVAVYALLQASGADPIEWNFPGNAFSTVGNPNDLAGYALLSATLLGCLWRPADRRWAAGVAGALVVIAAVIMASESRSGLAGLLVCLVLLPAFAWANRWPRAELLKLSVVVGSVVALAILIGLASGRAGEIETKLERSFDDPEGGAGTIDTRVDLWRGSFAVFAAHPVLGVGPDGLLSEFNRHRPADLGYPFDQRLDTQTDALVASPHNILLEPLVSMGVAGASVLLALTGLLAFRFWQILRTSRSNVLPFIGAGVISFLVFELLNPIAPTNGSLLAVVAGSVWGMTTTQRRVAKLPRTVQVGAYTAIGAAGLVLGIGAVVTLRADYVAASAIDASQSGDLVGAQRLSEQAATLMPLEQVYRRQDSRATATLAQQTRDTSLMQEAEQKQVQVLDDFPGLALDWLALARIRLILSEPGVEAALDEAVAASPHGPDTIGLAESMRAAAQARGLK